MISRARGTGPDGTGLQLVVHADDLGLTLSFNEGIRETATRGWLTSTCVRVNGPAFDAAMAEVVPECRSLGYGVHLNLVEGRTTRRRIARASPLYHADGTYRASFVGLLARQRDRALLREIELDYRDQIERAMNRLPEIDHLNSHQHSHAVPALFELVCRLAVEYEIPYVRLPRERFYRTQPLAGHLRPWYAINLGKTAVLNRLARTNLRTARRYGVRTNDWLVGIVYTGYMHADTVRAGLAAVAERPALVELLLHPTRPLAARPESYLNAEVRRYALHPARERELTTLLDMALAREIETAGWQRVTYRRLASAAAATPAARSVPDPPIS